MIEPNLDLRAHRLAALLFAFLSGASSVSMAIAPAIAHF
jgi:hypothetical protein